jgi:predicted oxidoreductase
MKFDVAIVGSGLAGLSVALHLAQTRTVAIISKRALLDGASNWAQGGIAAVLDSGDSHEEHINDTLVAGAGLCDEAATRYIVEHGREAIEWLIEQGVPFTRDPTAEMGFHLTREGGHSQRRIIHAADATGHAVQLTLEQKVRAHPNITLFEQHCAIDVISSDKLAARMPAPAVTAVPGRAAAASSTAATATRTRRPRIWTSRFRLRISRRSRRSAAVFRRGRIMVATDPFVTLLLSGESVTMWNTATVLPCPPSPDRPAPPAGPPAGSCTGSRSSTTSPGCGRPTTPT